MEDLAITAVWEDWWDVCLWFITALFVYGWSLYTVYRYAWSSGFRDGVDATGRRLLQLIEERQQSDSNEQLSNEPVNDET